MDVLAIENYLICKPRSAQPAVSAEAVSRRV
jgi:hypothetical protein